MTLQHRLVRGIRAALGCSCALLAASACASDWNDTFVGYRYGNFTEPGVSDSVNKNIVQFQSASGWKYGTNFFNLDVLSSGKADPSVGPYNPDGSGNAVDRSGATELYLVYRSMFSYSAITDTPLKFGALSALGISDVGLTVGGNLSSKNNSFASREKSLVIGPTLSFDVPGFATLSLLWHKEINYNGIVGTQDRFKPTYLLEAAWGIPFTVSSLPVKFRGYFDLNGPKGKDGFGNDTKLDFLLEAALMADVGSLVGRRDAVYMGIGYQYWHNKYGTTPSAAIGSKASSPQIQVEVHF